VFIYQGLGILLSFGLQAFISRTCGAAGLGGYALFISWLGILSIITVPGLEGTLVYYLPRYENDPFCRRKVVRVCLVIVGTISLLVAFLLLVAGDQVFRWAGLPSNAMLAFILSIISFSFGKLFDALFLGMKDASAAGYFNVVRTILRLLLCLPILFFPKEGWVFVLFSVACEGYMTLLLRFRKVYKYYPELLGTDKIEKSGESLDSKAILTNSAPMFGISLTDGLYPFLDKAILGAMLPLGAVGIYRVSESVASLNSVFVSPFVAFWPYISKLYNENRMEELCDAYRSINLLIITLMIPVSLVLIEISGWVLSLFGPVFALYGRTVFMILALGCVVDAIAGPAGAVLKMTKHSRLSVIINTVLLIVYIALCIALTKRFGLIGIATAKSVVMILGNVTNVTANYMLLKIFPYTWKHAWLLGLGVMIFTVTSITQGSGLHVGSMFIISAVEVILFACMAAIVLKSHIKRIVEFVRKLLSGDNAVANLWQA
jgi:O-antigen/teichoic acid export membrane protein